MGKAKSKGNKNQPTPGPSPAPAPKPITPPPPTAPGKVVPLFRRVDWLTFAITTLLVLIGYYLTLAPELTLEDSGELATASFYAGIPHPPGYPVWTMYTYLWTLLPFGSIAWRVALGEATSGAFACGLLALITSRGSSMMIESIAALKGIERRWENAICGVSGFVAGMLFGFNGFMWSQSVIVEVYSFSVLSFMLTLCCLLRWIYAPHQKRYLYWAFFLFGICVTNHQTLILATVGVEIAIAAAQPKIGRDLFLGNSLVFIMGLIAQQNHVITGFDNNVTLFSIYLAIGVGSMLACTWLWYKNPKSFQGFLRDGCLVIGLLLLSLKFFAQSGIAGWLGLAALLYWIKLAWDHRGKEPEMTTVFICGLLWFFGAAFYFYMAISGMTNPPMEWGYPRTVEGFFHALLRGQYEKITPTNVLDDPLKFLRQLMVMFEGIVDQFNWLYTTLALLPWMFYRRLQKRERAWLIGLGAIYLCLSMLLLIMLNPGLDRQSREMSKVVFAASHVVIALLIGYGLTLIAASLAVRYNEPKSRGAIIIGGLAAVDFAFFALVIASQDLLSNAVDVDTTTMQGLGKMLCWLGIAICFALGKKERFKSERPIFLSVAGLFGVASLGLTLMTMLGNQSKWDGFLDFAHTISISFNPNQYGLPIHAGLILFGMALVFLLCVVFRKNPPLGIALVLFAAMPINSIMCNWFDNEQRNHYFGYYFGHDMFTPPFVAPNGKLSYDHKLREKEIKGPDGKLIYPEMARNAILFGGTDPGRFCPTYMIFCESFTPARCKPLDPDFDRRDVYIITQNALADGTYLEYIRAQYFRSAQKDPPFFSELLRAIFHDKEYQTNFLARIAYTCLDKPLTAWGARVEAERRKEGVYPPKEIYTPSPEDSQNCFQEYLEDAQRRKMHDMQHPNQPREIKPGEIVDLVTGPDGKQRVQVSGQVAVMAINGLLCKVIFNHNPTNEFYVEESFPLDWMYPYLTPYGIIMKINRHPVPEITEDMVKRDHYFWSQYSKRLIGNWITYDTPIKQIAAFAEKVYLHNNFEGFEGDRKFVRDDDAQKSFSKLRSSIAGIYVYRINDPNNHNPAARQRMIKEADFALKQAFAFCPYSPEAVFRYVNFLMTMQRVDDALIVAQTCHKLDPDNAQVSDLVDNLQKIKGQNGSISDVRTKLEQMEQQVQSHPTDFQAALNLAAAYMQLQQTDRAAQILDSIVNNSKAPANLLITIAEAYAQMGNLPKVETVLEKLVTAEPQSPEAWYDLAAIQATLGQTQKCLTALKQSLNLSDSRLATNHSARDLKAETAKDKRFDSLRNLPEFKQITGTP